MLIGNLGGDPETKDINGEKLISKFSLATSETYRKTSGEKVTDTQWHNLVAWGKTAEIAEKFLTTDYLLQALKRMEKEGPNPTLATV